MKNFPLYLIVDFFTFLGPFTLSFDKKVAFYKKWFAVFPAIFIVGFFFITWDIWFTAIGVWKFNEKYLSGFKIFNLPIEEILFFFVVPYACLFIYECCKTYFSNILGKFTYHLPLFFSFLISVTLFFTWGRMYTTVTFSLTILFLLLLLRFNELQKKKYGYFWLAYFIHLIPFLVINGILTSVPVVIYNNNENLSIRLFTIPLEDLVYSLLLLLGNVVFYEKILEKIK